MIRVITVDDHPIVLRGVKEILSEEPDMELVGEANTASRAFELIRGTACDVVVLDISLPDKSGLAVLEQLRYEFPRLPVLILSIYPHDQYAVRVLKAGAAGYMTKESAPEELVLAIRKVISGGKYISIAVAEALAEDIAKGAEQLPHQTLSNREFQVLCMLASGETVTGIARALHVSAKTVSTYRTRILEKMQMKTNADLTRYAVENHIVN
ncbi:MAG TPA: response regulator transcription factor [Dissulfurispiraceae bacterium]